MNPLKRRPSSEIPNEPDTKKAREIPVVPEGPNESPDREFDGSPDSGNFSGATSSEENNPTPSPIEDGDDDSLLSYVMGLERFPALRSTNLSPPPRQPFRSLTQRTRSERVQVWLGLRKQPTPDCSSSTEDVTPPVAPAARIQELEEGELTPSECEGSLADTMSGITDLKSWGG
jgi:hypothetical protein